MARKESDRDARLFLVFFLFLFVVVFDFFPLVFLEIVVIVLVVDVVVFVFRIIIVVTIARSGLPASGRAPPAGRSDCMRFGRRVVRLGVRTYAGDGGRLVPLSRHDDGGRP